MEKIGTADDLAALLGVTAAAIRKAQKEGRFDRAVIRVEKHHKEKFRYHLALGCHEWLSKKQHQMNRRAGAASSSAIASSQTAASSLQQPQGSEMEPMQAARMQKHYSALLTKIDYLERAKTGGPPQ